MDVGGFFCDFGAVRRHEYNFRLQSDVPALVYLRAVQFGVAVRREEGAVDVVRPLREEMSRRSPRDQVPADVEGRLHVLRVLRLCSHEGGGAES